MAETLTTDFSVSFFGNDGSFNEVYCSELTWDFLQKYITFMEERGCHGIRVENMGRDEGAAEVYRDGGRTSEWGVN